MEYYNNILCATPMDLNGIIAYSTLAQLEHRGKAERVRRGCLETPALYSVESLPQKYKVEVYKRNPDYKGVADAKPLLDAIVTDGNAVCWFEQYTLPDGRHLPEHKQLEYSNNAAILNCCKAVYERCQSMRGRAGKSVKKGEFWRKVAAALPRISDKWPNSLPMNASRLQEKFRQYIEGGYETLINGRFMNQHAARIKDENQTDVLLRICSDYRNLNNAQVSEMYNCVAARMGWNIISVGTVAKFREKYSLEIAAGRYGMRTFNSSRVMTVKRSRPTLPLLYWTADGWDAELLYQKTSIDKRGHRVTTYSNRLTLEVILDPCLNYPIGYAIGDHETPELIKEALRNAVNHTAELFGHRHRVNQFQCDRYAIKAMTPLYEVIGSKVTPAQAHNAKAKVIEPYFDYINTNHCQYQENWSGHGATSSKELQVNVDELNAKRHKFPDRNGCAAQLVSIMETERARLHDEYVALYAKLPDEYRLPLSDEQYLLNFGESGSRKHSIEASGIRATIGGVRRDYDCFDMKFRQLTHLKWNVKYDPDDTSRVLAVSDDGSYRFMLEEKYVQPMALAERTEGDAEQLKKVLDFNHSIRTHVKDTMERAYSTTNRILEKMNEPDDYVCEQIDPTLSKLLICDSDGQHKNRRNAKRGSGVIDLKKLSGAAPATEVRPEGDDNDKSLYDIM